jgi:hypothetical protein
MRIIRQERDETRDEVIKRASKELGTQVYISDLYPGEDYFFAVNGRQDYPKPIAKFER